jgi:Protein of unknown function (DUF2380).
MVLVRKSDVLTLMCRLPGRTPILAVESLMIRWLTAVSIVLASLGARPAGAQDLDSKPYESPDARVAAFDVALYNAQANVQEATDFEKAELATQVLLGTLGKLLPGQLADSAAVRAAAGSDSAVAIAGGQSCNVIVACARAVARAVDAPWVVLAKVSKTSNLIWLLTAQLVHAPTGTIVLDDSTELKGEPEAMVRAGARIFAERVGRTVRAGGVTTNFPNP